MTQQKDEVLSRLQRKLDHFERELAITADPEKKFQLKEQIEEVTARINERKKRIQEPDTEIPKLETSGSGGSRGWTLKLVLAVPLAMLIVAVPLYIAISPRDRLDLSTVDSPASASSVPQRMPAPSSTAPMLVDASSPVTQIRGHIFATIFKGRSISFEVFAIPLNTGFVWIYEKTVRQKLNPDVGLSDLGDYFNQPGLTNFRRNSRAMIAVGSASREGNTKEQEDLAALRANVLKDILESAFGPPVYTLNLGKHNGRTECEDKNPAAPGVILEKPETACQRAVVIIAIRYVGDDIETGDIQTALDQAWLQEVSVDAGDLKAQVEENGGPGEMLPYRPSEFSIFRFSKGRANVTLQRP